MQSTNCDNVGCVARELYFLKSAVGDVLVKVVTLARSRIALKINIQADNVVDPIDWKIEHIPGLHDHLVSQNMREIRELLQIWC